MPEVRLCDKDAEIERIKQYCSARGCKYKYWSIYCKACEVSDIIDEFESAQEVKAKPVRQPVRYGRWEIINTDANVWKCTTCGDEWMLNDGNPSDNNMLFCPHCGSRMCGGADNDSTRTD